MGGSALGRAARHGSGGRRSVRQSRAACSRSMVARWVGGVESGGGRWTGRPPPPLVLVGGQDVRPGGVDRVRVLRACRQVTVLDPRRWRAGRSGGGGPRPRAAAGCDPHGVAGRGAGRTRGSASHVVPLGAAAGRTLAVMSPQRARGSRETALVATGRRRRVGREGQAVGATPGSTVAAGSPTTIAADRWGQYKGHSHAAHPLSIPSIAAMPGSIRLSFPSSATFLRVAKTVIVPSSASLVPSTARTPVVGSSPSWPPPSSGCRPPL